MSERLGIWHRHSFGIIVFVVFKHYMIYFKWTVRDFGQALAVPLLTAMLQHRLVALAISSK